MKRTSQSHPLQIAAIPAGPGMGRLGLTFCPGKYDPQPNGADHDRSIDLDLDAIRAWGAAAVVTLIEPKELTMLRVEGLGEGVMRRGMRWVHLPIADMAAPDRRFEQAWSTAGGELRALLREGRDVLIHCRGGRGRAGTIGARLLVELGMTPAAAIACVRTARPGAIETAEQENHVLALDPGSG
jgi:ADP-ribosyl-[dinitrogen reductase] hydrolase